LTVYGRSGGLQIYELLAMAGNGSDAPRWVGLYEAGLASYRARNFVAAMDWFEQALTERGDDPPSRIMIERCRLFLKTPPGDDWQATNAMQAK
jgi:adenylate cyclase